MTASRLEISELDDPQARTDAIRRVSRAFPSLTPGRRQDLVDVAGALLEAGEPSSRRHPTRLVVELDRGRLHGEVDYRKVRLLPRSRSAWLSGWVKGLAPVTALARHWGVVTSRTGVWFDLGR